MRLVELFLSEVSKTSLYEMTTQQQEFKKLWASRAKRVWLNLVKLKVLNSPTTYNHWRSRIDVHILDLMLDGNELYGKKITPKQMYEYFFMYMFIPKPKDIQIQIKNWKKTKYKNISVFDYNAQEVHDDIIKIMKSVFIKMYDDSFDSINDELTGNIHENM